MIGMDRYTGKRLSGGDHLGQSIDDILGTPVGTRLARRDYGSEIPKLIDQPNNELGRVRIIAAAAHALLRQEGRARLSRIVLSPGKLPQSAVLTITGRRTDVPGAPAFTHSSTVRALSALA